MLRAAARLRGGEHFVCVNPSVGGNLRPVNLELETDKRGEMDVYTAPRLRQALIDLVEGGATQIVVDMSAVDFLDSTGLGVLVGGLKRVKSNDGELRLVVSQDRIMKIFDITGLAKVFPIFDTADEALA